MESYGELLKNARENKGVSLDQAERDTAIAGQYIQAMESEDDSAFPGEPYFIGFIKNYSAYLGLKSDDVLALYRAKKIQESPVPVELLAHHTPKFLWPSIIVGVLALIIGVGCYLYFGVFKIPQQRQEKARLVEENKKIHTYEFDGTTQTKRMYRGDQILIPDGKSENDEAMITLTVVDTLEHLTLETPTGNQIVDLAEERELDLDGDGYNDIIFYLADVSNSDATKGAEVRMLVKDGETKVASSGKKPDESQVETAPTVTPAQVILESNRAFPFTVQVSFRGSCLFRYRVDRQEKIEDYYKTSDVVTVTASNAARLWMSNGNTLSITVIADSQQYPLEIGRAGQVKAEDIKWIRDGEGKYRLVVVDLD